MAAGFISGRLDRVSTRSGRCHRRAAIPVQVTKNGGFEAFESADGEAPVLRDGERHRGNLAGPRRRVVRSGRSCRLARCRASRSARGGSSCCSGQRRRATIDFFDVATQQLRAPSPTSPPARAWHRRVPVVAVSARWRIDAVRDATTSGTATSTCSKGPGESLGNSWPVPTVQHRGGLRPASGAQRGEPHRRHPPRAAAVLDAPASSPSPRC